MRAATLAALAVVAIIVVGSTLAGHLHKEFLLQRAYDSLGRAVWIRSIKVVGGGVRGPALPPMLLHRVHLLESLKPGWSVLVRPAPRPVAPDACRIGRVVSLHWPQVPDPAPEQVVVAPRRLAAPTSPGCAHAW